MAQFRRSYSQVAEDLLAAFYLRRDQEITYVDVGCLWPIEHSNTYYFYQRLGKGVCIDPNPTIREEYEAARPRDQFFNCGVSSAAASMTYFQFSNPVFNTFSEVRAAELQAMERRGRELIGQAEVQVRSLDSILREADWRGRFGAVIDFLSVDVEGHEYDVIQSLDFAYARPKLVVLEAVIKAERGKGQQAHQLLLDQGYAVCGQTGHDTFFLDETNRI